MIYKIIAASLFVAQISVGFHFLRKSFASIRPTTSSCAAAFLRDVPSSPCLAESGILSVGAPEAVREPFGASNLDDLCVIFFCFGALVAGFASSVLYRKHLAHLRKNTSMASTIPSAFAGKVLHYLEFMTQKRYVHIFQTFTSLVSIIVWAIATSLPDDVDRMLELLSPHNSVEETKTIALWYSCGSRRLDILVADLMVQGCVAYSLVIWLLAPVKPQNGDYRFATIDFLQASSVVWALPATIYWSGARPYNFYLFSGFFRTLRIFEGVPELARHYNLFEPETPDRFHKSTVPSFLLLMGQFALVVKILFFLSFASLLLIAVEGWPCAYHVVARSPCSCFAEFRTFEGTIYFVFTTMTTVGFGDIVPRTSAGRLAVITLIVTGVYLAPTWIGQVKKQHTQYMNAKRSEQVKSQKRGPKYATAEALASRGANRLSATNLQALGEEEEEEERGNGRESEDTCGKALVSPRTDVREEKDEDDLDDLDVDDVDEGVAREHQQQAPQSSRQHEPQAQQAVPQVLHQVVDVTDVTPTSHTLTEISVSQLPEPQQPQQPVTQPKDNRNSLGSQRSSNQVTQLSFRAKLGAMFGRLGSSHNPDGEVQVTSARQQPPPLSSARPVAQSPTLHPVEQTLDDKVARDAVGHAEWSSALHMIEKQNSQMNQQQAMLQYLLDFMVEVSTSDSQQRVVHEVVATLRNIPHHDLELPSLTSGRRLRE